jgi:glucosamine-6-phosphate deaminase
LVAAAARYEAEIQAAGGLDLALLGIGVNGHIAFNEPPAAFDSRTHVEALRADTRAANQPFFGSTAVPSLAVTMGIGTILAGRRCVLLATGAGKAAALGRAVDDPPSAAVPASALQLHPNATILADESAASLLSDRQRLRRPPTGA